MRKTGAVCRPDSIDAAFIVLKIEELAGLFFIYPITYPVFIHPFLFELIRSFTKVPRDSFYIGLIKSRRHCFTAIGTAQAICFLPYFRLCSQRQFHKSSGGLVL